MATEPLDALGSSRASTISAAPVLRAPKAEEILAFIITEALRCLPKTVPTLDWECQCLAQCSYPVHMLQCKCHWSPVVAGAPSVRAGGPRVTVVSLGEALQSFL